MAKPLQIVNKAFKSPEDERIQLQLIGAWNENRRKYNGVLQLELHLHDEKEVLEGKKKKKKGIVWESES